MLALPASYIEMENVTSEHPPSGSWMGMGRQLYGNGANEPPLTQLVNLFPLMPSHLTFHPHLHVLEASRLGAINQAFESPRTQACIHK